MQYEYNLEPPKWTFTDNNLGSFHEIGVISNGEIFANDDQNIADIEYRLQTNPEGRYKLTKNGQYVKLELVQMSDESIIDILTIEATERNVIPERTSIQSFVVQIVVDIITTTHSTDTTHSTMDTSTSDTTTDPTDIPTDTTTDTSDTTTETTDTTTTPSPIPEDCTWQFDFPFYEIDMSEGDGKSTYTCAHISPRFIGNCSEEIINSSKAYIVEKPQFLANFIDWNHDTGELKCTRIKTDSEDLNYSTDAFIKIRATIPSSPYFDIKTGVSLHIFTTNNHAPEFTSDTLTIGFPNFVYLKSLPYPITYFEVTDADRKPTDSLTFTTNNPNYYVDPATKGLYYNGPNEYLEDKVTMKVTVNDGIFTDDLDLQIIPLDQDKVIPLKLNCVNCANQALINQLNDQYNDHHFRLLSVLNNDYIYVTIQKLTNERTNQDDFLSKSQAEELLQNVDSESVEVTDNIKVEVPDTSDSGAYMPVAIVFIVLFCLILGGNIGLLVYFKYQRKLGFGNSASRSDLVNGSEDRFSDTFARNNYIKNQIEAQNNGTKNQLDAPELSEKNERKISFNENAEVIDSEDEQNSTTL